MGTMTTIGQLNAREKELLRQASELCRLAGICREARQQLHERGKAEAEPRAEPAPAGR